MNRELSLNEHYREVLLHYDFRFFLEKDIEQNNYSPEDIRLLHISHQETLIRLKRERKKNKRQHHYWLEGQVRLMFEGQGFLPGFLRLDGRTRGHLATNFQEFGKDWGVFDFWQKYERRKFHRKKAWEYITKGGALLAILLAILKLWEILTGTD